MVEEDIRAQIKRIKIYTKRLVSNAISGDYLSAFKGSGMEFHQIRDYQMGDDIRSIDWNSSVKTDKLMVKQFIQERDRTVILMIDVSSSGQYASNLEVKRELVAKVASTLVLIANESNDKVGAMFFSDIIESWIPAGRGAAHVNKILETILTLKPRNDKTSIAEALRFLIGLKKHDSVVFLLSDFIDDINSYSNLLKVATCKHDFIGIRITDECEKNIPDVGLLEVIDSETGEPLVLDTRKLGAFLQDKFVALNNTFDKYRTDLLDLTTNKPFTHDLIKFFRKRIRRSI